MSGNLISDVNRRDILDYILMRDEIFGDAFYGKLDAIEFLRRTWNLAALPSTDFRFETAEEDITQHFVNNDDWNVDYLLSNYLELTTCPDATFLRFLENYTHPRIVIDKSQTETTVAALNRYLVRDGYKLQVAERISGWPIYKASRLASDNVALMKQHERMPEEFPFEADEMVHTLIEMLMHRGAAREVGLLAFASQQRLEKVGFDDYAGGIYSWLLAVQVLARVYAPIPPAEVEESENVIRDAANELIKGNCYHCIESVSITAEVNTQPGIKESAIKWLNGDGVNNQGRVRSTNIAAREADGLLFRSQPEILLYRALKALGVTFAPLPVFLHGGSTYQRIEPDFVLFKDSILMVVEVDGDTVHCEAPAEADQRVRLFKHEGAFVERVLASECDTEENARKCAAQLLNIMAKYKAQR